MANVTVGNTNDVVNGTTTSIAALIASNGGDGISLREAVLAANADAAADVINFSVTGVIPLTNALHVGEIVINNNVTITGPGASLLAIVGFAGSAAAGDGARIFNVDDSNLATFKDVSISGLTLSGADSNGQGGAIRVGRENLTISDCTINGNSAATGGGIGNINAGHLTINGSTISGNTTTGRGGGIETISGSLSVTASTISGNTSVGSGGGVYGTSSTITIDSSTISGNSSTINYGGGVFHTGVGILTTITNSTISGNSARIDGGGVAVVFGDMIVRHSTITLNKADSDNNGTGSGGGIFVNSVFSNATINHTIVAGNLRQVSTRDDIFGAIVASSAFNLVGVNTGLTGISNGANGNQIGTSGTQIDPLLGGLIHNAGPTRTHSLLVSSPAIDAGDAAFSPPPPNDQRGTLFARVAEGDGAGGARIDIGAYERQTLSPRFFVVDTLIDENDGNYSAGDISLREAIAATNGSAGPDTITFAASLTSGGPATILLLHGELAIGESLTISGPGAGLLTIDASGSDPTPAIDNQDGSNVFNINDGAVSLQNVTLRGMTLTGADSGGGSVFAPKPAGTILSTENLTVTDCIINDGGPGAILSNAGSSAPNSLIVRDSTISGNGGSISQSFGSLVIEQTTIANNGLGIHAQSAQVDIRGTTVANNSGRGIHIDSGSATITGSTISGNQLVVYSPLFGASASGGGIYSTGNLILRHCTITNNLASAHSSDPFFPSSARGGGLCLSSDVTAVLDHTIVAGNRVMADQNIVPDIFGSVSARFSLIGSQSGGTITNNGGNLIGFSFDPLLGPLADNGGPTRTHALLVGSPAIDAGDPTAVAGAGTVPQFDQRGDPFRRVFNGDGAGGARIDMGAFEFIPSDTVPALFGDYNRNSVVDAADYILWRKTLGTGSLPAFSGADGDGDTTIDPDDHGVWRAHFGETVPELGAGSGSGPASMVENQVVSAYAPAAVNIAADFIGGPVVQIPAVTISASVMTDAAAARAVNFAALETRSQGHESTSRSRSRLHRFELTEASGHDLLMLLAANRLSPSPRQDSFVNYGSGSGENRADDDGSESEFDEPLAVARAVRRGARSTDFLPG